jgi:uncharacterized membrane protein (UPF0127 family)
LTYIRINGVKFNTLVALTMDEQQQGLMGYAWPPPNMVFLYKNSSVRKFWMKNTPSPLDILFCNNNKIVSICYGEPNSQNLIGPNKDCNLVIEFPFSTCERFKIKNGDHVELNFSTEVIEKYESYKYFL